jgi:Transposase DDE domain
MQTRLRLWHTWQTQIRTLLPTVRATRAANLALLALGLLWAGTTSLPVIAAALPLPAVDASLERRLRRWLANTAVVVRALWTPLLPPLLAGKAGQEVVLVFDPTPQNGDAAILVLGIVHHKRVLPLAWRVLPQQTAWAEPQIVSLRAMGEEVAAALPADCTVTLLADRGITGPEVIDLCGELGWHYVLRVSVGPNQTNRVRVLGTVEGRLWELVRGPGQRWAGRVELFKAAGWRRVNLTIRWDQSCPEPWVLVSDRPAGSARVREYRRRMRAEATYQDCKTRGFAIERSKLRDLARLDRLLLALHLALWWGEQLGLRAIRTGQRRRSDRADRRDLSVLRLGRCYLMEDLLHDRCPPLPFHHRPTGWCFTWLA